MKKLGRGELAREVVGSVPAGEGVAERTTEEGYREIGLCQGGCAVDVGIASDRGEETRLGPDAGQL